MHVSAKGYMHLFPPYKEYRKDERMELQDFFRENPRVAIAFSGGVDSAYLLYAAQRYAKSVRAYYVSSEFQPAFERADAVRLAEQLGADMKILTVAALDTPHVRENPANRCYYCKQGIFGASVLRLCSVTSITPFAYSSQSSCIVPALFSHSYAFNSR